MKVIVITSKDMGVFVNRDVELIRKLGHDVDFYRIKTPLEFYPSIISKLLDRKTPVIFWGGWDAGWWTLLPKTICTPLIVIMAGSEVLTQEKLGGNPKQRRLIHRALSKSNVAVWVAKHLLEKAIESKLPIPPKNIICSTSIDKEFFRPREKTPKTASLIAILTTTTRVYLKGIDRLNRLARYNSSWAFNLVGVGNMMRKHIHVPDNVKVHSIITEEEVAKILGESEVILNLSRWEGMPNTLIEGMMCGCVPVVVNDVPSLPGAIGDMGYVLDNAIFDLDKINKDTNKIREYAIEHFGIEHRLNMWNGLFEWLEKENDMKEGVCRDP